MMDWTHRTQHKDGVQVIVLITNPTLHEVYAMERAVMAIKEIKDQVFDWHIKYGNGEMKNYCKDKQTENIQK